MPSPRSHLREHFPVPCGLKLVIAESWAASPQLHLAALVVWRMVEHRPTLVSKCCWSASGMPPGVFSCQKRGAERWHLCSSLKGHANPWSAATMLYCSLAWFPHKPHIWDAPEVRAGNSSAYFKAWLGGWGGGDPWFMCWGRLQWVSQSLLIWVWCASEGPAQACQGLTATTT